MDKNSFKVSVVVPVFNEEDNIRAFLEKTEACLREYASYEIIFVDDGSHDKTLELLKGAAAQNNNIKYLSFSRNFGHQSALRAGLDHVSGDCAISIDADLQHPPEFIPQMVLKWKEGYEIVYTVREDSRDESFFKRKTSALFYRIIRMLSDIDLKPGSADFRLIDRKVLNELKEFREYNLFLRGIISWIGFRQCYITYRPGPRQGGTSKYSLKKMFLFSIVGITSFSTKPLYLSVLLGFLLFIPSFVYGIMGIYQHFFTNRTVLGWTSIITIVVLVGGIQLIMTGIIGIYLGKMFEEVKSRPPYIIRESSFGE